MPMPRRPVPFQRRIRPIRFNDPEWAQVCENAKAAGATPSEFVRSAALRNRVPNRANERAVRALFDVGLLVRKRYPLDADLIAAIQAKIAEGA